LFFPDLQRSFTNMRPPIRFVFFSILLLGITASAPLAQSTQKQGTGTITGQIMLNDKGMANVTVVLYSPERTPERTAAARATTDYEGHYRLAGVPAGRYNVIAIAPAMVGQDDGILGGPGKAVTIAEGETVEKIDFSLVRGGVITGRVTDADGAPVIGERVNLSPADKPLRGGRAYSPFSPFMYQTDDRGVYRLYGLSPGRYTVSIGESPENVTGRFGGRGYYTRTFHPNVTDESKATVIEVTEGSEASNVDITLGRRSQSFAATGRVVDENGKPVPNVRVGQGAVMQDQKRLGSFGFGAVTDDNGHFRLDGMRPGRYAAFVWSTVENGGYSDPLLFEIAEGDISGLELKMRRGATISGVAVIEGTTDRSVVAQLSQLRISARPSQPSETLAAPIFAATTINPDGSFRITGLQPGKNRLYLSSYPPLPGFTLTRVEREGIAVREIDVATGAQVTGLRVVIEYGTGSVQGMVKVENGTLPEGLRMNVIARRTNEANGPMSRGSQVDTRGRYLLEGLATGEYEISLYVYLVTTGSRPRGFPPIKQNVTVTSGAASEVNFTFDLNTIKEGGPQQ
jgi:protocatechuate 3,4-dioxygenase beta subunit